MSKYLDKARAAGARIQNTETAAREGETTQDAASLDTLNNNMINNSRSYNISEQIQKAHQSCVSKENQSARTISSKSTVSPQNRIFEIGELGPCRYCDGTEFIPWGGGFERCANVGCSQARSRLSVHAENGGYAASKRGANHG